jgi:hypothetical protein
VNEQHKKEVKPKLFIGSSSESLPFLEFIANELRDQAEVTRWNDGTVFKATNMNVEDLLQAPLRFDFGLFLLEADDVITSRHVRSAAPRDNVVFELGLFMSQLGLKRAFPVAPKRDGHTAVKIMSDIQGWQPIFYDESPGLRKLRNDLAAQKDRHSSDYQKVLEDFRTELRRVLPPTIETIRGLLQRGTLEVFGVSLAAPNVGRVGQIVERLVRSSLCPPELLSVKHLALDMVQAWPVILQSEIFLEKKDLQYIQWKCLMIDPRSEAIKDIESTSVSVSKAADLQKEIKEYCASKYAASLAQRHVFFECRAYSLLPLMHGFLIGTNSLLWSMCDIPDERLDAVSTPYFSFDATQGRADSSHVVRSFENWFDYLWKNKSRLIASSEPER